MKRRPIQRYPEPEYPTREQARQNPGLLQHLPARWEKVPGFAALLGLLSLTATRAEAAEEGPPPPALDPEAAARDHETAPAVQKAGAVVAPILAEALERDGRGAFGCVAIDPPSFLSEDEALELIRTELEAAGLQLRDDALLEDMTAPTEPAERVQIVGEKNGASEIRYGSSYGEPNELGRRPVRFDWADPRRAVYIEYLTRRDYREWEGYGTSTADYYDFSKLAQRVAEAYGKYPAEQRTVFGVFFDPLAHEGVEVIPVANLPPEEKRQADAEYKWAAAAAKDDRGRDKLRRQVRHFIEFLRQEGVLPPAK